MIASMCLALYAVVRRKITKCQPQITSKTLIINNLVLIMLIIIINKSV